MTENSFDSETLAERVDAVCDSFEQRWKSGERPTIEGCLNSWTDPQRSALALELLQLELQYRQRAGEQPDPNEYSGRFSVDLVRVAFESVEGLTETIDYSQSAAEETVLTGDRSADGGGNPAPVGKRFGSYELLDEIAQGGMGVVYKARQDGLNRVVALKMIKTGQFADAEEVRRFYAEAEAAAALDHPHIVPIYEVGAHAGQHFFSMGFVEGESLADRLKNGPLQPKDAARLLRTIAQAVQFAHDRGIVHRDLKPANVLLEDGNSETQYADEQQSPAAGSADSSNDLRPRLTDFGLAKNIAGDSGMTTSGQILGTPSYMPPEQAAGRVAEVGPLSDVYSLGAVLYCALTGRPPFQAANVMDTLQQVLRKEPVSPRRLNDAIDRDLETICLKCLDKDPARRYQSAAALAEELQRYLERRPILARPVGRFSQLLRWTARNRVLATVSFIAFLTFSVLAIGGPIMAWKQSQLSRRATTEAGNAKAALAKETIAKRKLMVSLDDQHNVIQLFVRTTKDETLLREPRFKPVLKRQLDLAFRHFQKFIDDHKDDTSLRMRRKLADSLMEVADISRERGDKQEAIEAYRRAIRMWEEVVAASADSDEARHQLAGCRNNLAVVLGEADRVDEAMAEYRELIRIRTVLMEHADKPRNLRQLAGGYVNFGAMNYRRGKTDAALQAYRQADAILSRLDPADPDTLNTQAAVQNNLGLILESRGDIVDAIAAYRQAMTVQGKLANRYPRNARIQSQFAAYCNNLGVLYRSNGQGKQSLPMYTTALRVRKKLAKMHPTVTEYQAKLARSYSNLGNLYSDLGRDPNQFIELYTKASDIQRSLVREYQSVADYREDLATTLNGKGLRYEALDETTKALRAFAEAVEVRKELVARHPTITEYRLGLAETLLNISGPLQTAGKRDEARAKLQHAIRLLNELVAENPKSTRYRVNLGKCHNDLGVLHEDCGENEKSRLAYQAAIRIREELLRGTSDPSIESLRELAQSRRNLGLLLERLGELDAALAALKLDLQSRQKIAQAGPGETQHRVELANSHFHLANVYQKLRQPREAHAAFRESLQRQQRLCEEFPDNLQYRNTLAGTRLGIGLIYRSQRDYRKALAEFAEAVRIFVDLVKSAPDHIGYKRSLAGLLNDTGALRIQLANRNSAVSDLRQAESILGKIEEAGKLTESDRSTRATARLNLGLVTADRVEAARILRRARDDYRQLIRLNPNAAEYQANLGKCCFRLATLANSPQQTVAMLEHAINHFERASNAEVKTAGVARILRAARWGRAKTLSDLGRYAEAVLDLRNALNAETEPKYRRLFGERLALWCAKSGQHRSAAALADKLLKTTTHTNNAYTLLTVYAAAAFAANTDPGLTATDRERAVGGNRSQAMKLLRLLVRSGHFRSDRNRLKMRHDPALNPLRHRPEFHAVALSAGIELPAWAARPRSSLIRTRSRPAKAPIPKSARR